MNPNKLSVRFVIVKAKTNKQHQCPISCRLTYKKLRHGFNTGLFLKSGNWVSQQQRVNEREEQHHYINTQIQQITLRLNQAFLELQIKKVEFNVKDIYRQYNGEKALSDYNTIQHFKDYLIALERLIGRDIKLQTWKKFEYVKNDVESFVKFKFKSKDIPLKKLNLQFLMDFEYYLKVTKDQKQITINKSIQRFRKIIKDSVAKGYLDYDPFLSYKTKTVRKEVVFLTSDELEALERLIVVQRRLKHVRDLFVFSCYTGLAYNELSRFGSKHITTGFDGDLWIQMVREKTSKPFSIPILPKAMNIITQYSYNNEVILPKISNQKYNSYLKEIGAVLGIEKRLTSHTARKTFASTVLLYNDVPMEIVSELLGHSSMKITQDSYGKIVNKSVSRAINILKDKL